MTIFINTPNRDLTVDDIVLLDGTARKVLEITLSEVANHRYIHFEGFTTALHVGDDWGSMRVIN